MQLEIPLDDILYYPFDDIILIAMETEKWKYTAQTGVQFKRPMSLTNKIVRFCENVISFHNSR